MIGEALITTALNKAVEFGVEKFADCFDGAEFETDKRIAFRHCSYILAASDLHLSINGATVEETIAWCHSTWNEMVRESGSMIAGITGTGIYTYIRKMASSLGSFKSHHKETNRGRVAQGLQNPNSEFRPQAIRYVNELNKIRFELADDITFLKELYDLNLDQDEIDALRNAVCIDDYVPDI